MRETRLQSTESLRALPSYYWPDDDDDRYRPVLNIRRLLTVLETIEPPPISGALRSASEDKKRVRSESPICNASPRRSKRLKTVHVAVPPDDEESEEDGSDEESEESGYELDEGEDFIRMPYPTFVSQGSEENDEDVAVYRHLVELQYTKAAPDGAGKQDVVNDARAKRLGWLQEEQDLDDALKKLCGALSEPMTVEIEELECHEYAGRLVLALSQGSYMFDWDGAESHWFLTIPSFIQPVDVDAHDYPSDKVLDIMWNVATLGSMNRVVVTPHLQLILLPLSSSGVHSDEPLFRFHIELDVALSMPNICSPIARKESKKRIAELEGAQRRFLSYLYPGPSSPPNADGGDVNMHTFYSVLRPAPKCDTVIEQAMQPDDLLPTLLPFQRRSIAWMLDKEGKCLSQAGAIVAKPESDVPSPSGSLSLFWEKIEERDHVWYYNRVSGALANEPPQAIRALGGILAEEPGLGKTLECIALIMLTSSPPKDILPTHWDSEAKLDVKEIRTTLIVTPPALASQWVDEFALHAPTLKVYVYNGWDKLDIPITEADATKERSYPKKERAAYKGLQKKRRAKAKAALSDSEMDIDEESEPEDIGDDKVLDWCSWINKYDVCITTYTVLQQDMHVARAVPNRPRREDVEYSSRKRPRSPLVMCEWKRVIMDEVQMSTGKKTEEMVSLIPRLSSFAVSGTPAKAQVQDMIHVLRFLRVDAIVEPIRIWNRLFKPAFTSDFAALFQQYSIRTVKAAVQDELTIPQQTRYLVGIKRDQFERHVYDQHLETALLALGLDARGVAVTEGWQVDGSLLRSTLRRLRGICTHPQVGQLQKQGEKGGTLKTMPEILAAMRDQNWRNLMDDWKLKVQESIRFAQLQQRNEADRTRYQHALDTLKLAERDAEALIQAVKAAIANHDAKGGALKKDTVDQKATAAAVDVTDPGNEPEVDSSSTDKGKGKAIEDSPAPSASESVDSALPRNAAGHEHSNKKAALQQRLRECKITLHRVKFLQGDVYHVLGASFSAQEDAAYEAADKIRRELLKTTEQIALRAMAQLSSDVSKGAITEDELHVPVPYLGAGGIRSNDLMDEANEIIAGILNKQSALLWTWRARIRTLLTQSLTPDGGEADGQEYQRTLDDQGEAETYLQAYAALLADRREVLVNERTLLAAHDVREKTLRHTKAAMRAAAATQDEFSAADDIELQPEHEALQLELSALRKELIQQLDGRAIKSILVDLNGVSTKIYKESDPEGAIVKEAVARLRRLISDQGKVMDKLDADLAQSRRAFNDRILFYRQLQEISDSVAEVVWESSLADAIADCKAQQVSLEAKVNTTRARQRFMDNLAYDNDNGVVDEESRACVLCRCDFVRGFITQCAHIFCEDCMKAWLLRKEGKTCPVCRVAIDANNMQRFTVNEEEAPPPPKPILGEPAPQSRRQIQYNMIDDALLAEIQKVESDGSYGSKIQTLVRHLLYLRKHDPESKSIVFSAWADSLHIIEHALTVNGIRCIRIDQKKKGQSAAKRFRTDHDIYVLLLHGERENAGLNVTCASRVFLVESVVHHGFEVQAIARIDRMGQRKATEVYCYYAEETVEKNILDLAARRGLSLYTKDNSAGTLNVSSFETEADKKTIEAVKSRKVQKGDFIYKVDDMLAILFPHMFEDIDYLILPENEIMAEAPAQSDAAPQVQVQESNAVAGPSRVDY